MTLAIFDFDGTITKGDSLVRFILYTHGSLRTAIGFLVLSPVLFLYVLKILPNWKTKEIVLAYCYKGWDLELFNRLAAEFAKSDLNKIVKPAALEKIKWHINEGHRVVVVSASIENYLESWCWANRVELLGTRLQIEDGQLTGKIEGKNCHGPEKVRRIQEKYNLKDFDFVYAYGDSRGDLALKEIAQEFHYCTFK